MKKLIILVLTIVIGFSFINSSIAYSVMPPPNIYGPSMRQCQNMRPYYTPYSYPNINRPYYYGNGYNRNNSTEDWITGIYVLTNLVNLGRSIQSDQNYNNQNQVINQNQIINNNRNITYVQTEYGLVPIEVYNRYMK